MVNCSNVTYIDELVNRAVDGNFSGDKRLKDNGKPKFTQRTSFLYYYRSEIDKPLMWATIAMGGNNAYPIFADKKESIENWKRLNPIGFEKIKHYIPRIWGTYENLKKDVDYDSIYVYKPSKGYGGQGISFESGESILDITKKRNEAGDDSWVVQEFIMPFLYNNRKTHFRVLSLVIVQPSGVREAYMYNRMRMFVAKDEFNIERLYDPSDDKTLMLMTNINVTYEKFIKDPNNTGKEFDWMKYLIDAEDAFGKEEYAVIHSKMRGLHSGIYSTIGDYIECHKTDVSIYSNACFHIIASDVALDQYGEPHLLETNIAMAMRKIWRSTEIREFTGGAAYLMDLPDSPYDHGIESDVWSRIL